mmetsp:Transcript_107822/g.344205  ORF Transcript_107822/g.344205 Transcript_107822/m.344205 type:complete len:169 (+) Transcript_107822:50-556(+)
MAVAMASVAAMARPTAYARSCAAVCASFALGDVACQRIEGEEWHPRRTTEFAFVGGAVLGPASHTLELGLERFFPGTGVRSIARKVGCRVLVSPLFLSLNFGSLAALRGQDVSAQLRSKVFPAWQTGCFFWPAVATLTYKFVPLLARPAAGSAVGCAWSCYLSLVAHR